MINCPPLKINLAQLDEIIKNAGGLLVEKFTDPSIVEKIKVFVET